MTDETEEELDLNDLDDTELVEQMHDDLYDGLRDEVVEGTEILLARGWTADKVLNVALVGGMQIVGVDFRDGILFVPEVLLAAKRYERRHGNPSTAARGNRCKTHWKNGHWYRQR